MAIKFICPNGHHLAAAEERAGQPGRCPRCGTAFLVPDEPEFAAQSNAARQPAAHQQDLIIFLCPNGHKLNGPVSLAGKPGQCPHCGIKFLIPTGQDDSEPTSRSGVPIGARMAPGAAGSGVDIGSSKDMEKPLAYEDIPLVDALPDYQNAPSLENGSSFADLFAWLWARRDEQTVVDLHLPNGETFTPQFYSPELSQKEFGVFATLDESGQYTVTTLSWSIIQRVSIRNLADIPRELFE